MYPAHRKRHDLQRPAARPPLLPFPLQLRKHERVSPAEALRIRKMPQKFQKPPRNPCFEALSGHDSRRQASGSLVLNDPQFDEQPIDLTSIYMVLHMLKSKLLTIFMVLK